MAVTARRRLETTTTRRFGSGREAYAIPDLTEIQTKSYARFLQYETPHDKRKDEGLEGVLKEIFPIESYDKKLSLSYLRYELGKPRYEPDECRQLRLTYGRPFRIWLRLNKEQPIDEEVYLGDLARRRRIYHQWRRARGGEPVASQPGYRLRFRDGGRRAPTL
jgi:DNA-directed RNA polymerase subunit beta